MSTYDARPEVIAIPVDEYKELLAANTELKIIYHKLESCAIPSEKYTFDISVSDISVADDVVTVTPIDALATYYCSVFKMADFDKL